MARCVVVYDENSVAWLEEIDRPGWRFPLQHGQQLSVIMPLASPVDANKDNTVLSSEEVP